MRRVSFTPKLNDISSLPLDEAVLQIEKYIEPTINYVTLGGIFLPIIIGSICFLLIIIKKNWTNNIILLLFIPVTWMLRQIYILILYIWSLIAGINIQNLDEIKVATYYQWPEISVIALLSAFSFFTLLVGFLKVKEKTSINFSNILVVMILLSFISTKLYIFLVQ